MSSNCPQFDKVCLFISHACPFLSKIRPEAKFVHDPLYCSLNQEDLILKCRVYSLKIGSSAKLNVVKLDGMNIPMKKCLCINW